MLIGCRKGYETVFRQEHHGKRTYDLTIKDSNDTKVIKNIEVKKVTSNNPSKISDDIIKGFKQVGIGGTVAIYLENHTKSTGEILAKTGYAEAKRKGKVFGSVEIWYKDKTMQEMR